MRQIMIEEQDLFKIWSNYFEKDMMVNKIISFIDNGVMETPEGLIILERELFEFIKTCDRFYMSLKECASSNGIGGEIKYNIDFNKRKFEFETVKGGKYDMVEYSINSLNLNSEFEDKIRNIVEVSKLCQSLA